MHIRYIKLVKGVTTQPSNGRGIPHSTKHQGGVQGLGSPRKVFGSTSCKPFINGGFHKWGIPQNGWFIREHPIKHG